MSRNQYGHVIFTTAMWDQWQAARKSDARTLELREGIQTMRMLLAARELTHEYAEVCAAARRERTLDFARIAGDTWSPGLEAREALRLADPVSWADLSVRNRQPRKQVSKARSPATQVSARVGNPARAHYR